MRPDLRRIVEIAPLIQSGAVSPVDLVRGCLAQISARPMLNAFITVTADAALDEAANAEADVRAGRYRGPLHGIPVSIKDLIDVAGIPTTSGSAVPPITPTVDAPVVQRLKNAGAIIVGKTNLHEFAFGTTSEESAFGPVRNPYDESRSAGGSSGGAAAALAAGMCFGAIGTDTGGSIRIPSAACGTVGLKPTSGELSTDGVVPLSATLDHVGPMTRGVADAALMYEALTGASSRASDTPPRVLGVPRPYFCDRLDPGVGQALSRACDALVRRGYSLRDVVVEDAAWTPDVYLHIVLPEASCYHARGLELHGSRYSPGVRLRLEMGRYVLAEDYIRAMRLRDVLTGSVDRALNGCDALLLPALPITAPPLGAATVDVGGTIEPVRAAMLRLTQLFNVTGHPAIALPTTAGSDGLPRGLQLVGRRHATAHLLDVAASVEACIAGDR